MRVICVQQNDALEKFLVGLLSQHEIDVIICRNLQELEVAWTDEPKVDIVITSHVVDERDMFSYVHYLMRKTRRILPVVAHAGEEITQNAMRASQAGIKYFLPLPFSPAELIEILFELHNKPFIYEKNKIIEQQVVATQREGISDFIEQSIRSYFLAHEGKMPPVGLYDRLLKEVETPLIKVCLEFTKHNRIKTAEVLGLNRNTLRKKMLELKLEKE